MSVVVNHAVCQGCGCLCDDVELEVADNAISRIEHACDLGRGWYASQTAAASSIDGEFLWSARETLKAARLPIILGVESLTSEVQRSVIRLAQRIGGVIASESCTAMEARQEVGEVTATLGEIKSRADLIVFWFADPMRTHPRYLERYATGTGRFVDRRTIVVVNEVRNSTSELPGEFVQCDFMDEFDAIQQLRLLVAPTRVETQVDERWKSLAEKMKAANYGAMVFEPFGGSSMRCEAIFKLVRELNRHTSFVVAPLGNGGNAKGAENVLQWTTGFPANVNFSAGEARYNGDEYSADELLRRGRVDAAFILSGWDASVLSTEAAHRLAEIPTIRARTASALQSSGTVFRMDGIPLLTKALWSHGSTAESATDALVHEIGQRTDLAVSTNA